VASRKRGLSGHNPEIMRDMRQRMFGARVGRGKKEIPNVGADQKRSWQCSGGKKGEAGKKTEKTIVKLTPSDGI